MIRVVILLLVLCLCPPFLKGQVIENYDQAIAIEKGEAWYMMPEKAIIRVELGEFPMADLLIKIPANSSAFIDGQMWFFTAKDTSFSISLQELAEQFPASIDSRELVFYNKDLQDQPISVKKGIFSGDLEVKQEGVIPDWENEREKPVIERFFVVAALITFSFIALYKLIFPLVINFIIRPASVFSTEDYYESNSLTKFFSEEILIFLFIFNMLLMLLILVFGHYLDLGGLGGLLRGDINHLYFVWLSGTGFLLLLSWIRFAWIKISAMLFGINRLEFTHFFFILRIVSLILVLIFICLFISIINGIPGLENFVEYLLWLSLMVYFLGVSVLFFIMTKKLSIKNYHLFSYLCTAELVPFLVLSKLIIG